MANHLRSLQPLPVSSPVKSIRIHARSLGRTAKRYDAVATATPFVIATVGFYKDFPYCNIVIYYTVDNIIRILDPYNPSPLEIIVSILCQL